MSAPRAEGARRSCREDRPPHDVQAEALVVVAQGRARCELSVHNAGTTFVHPAGAHNFVNTGMTADGLTLIETEFYIVWVVPAGASPGAIDVTPAPEGCAA